jgi:hypothetical protein
MKAFLRFALMTLALHAAPASAGCPPLAQVDWWVSTVADVNNTVATNFKGDWDAYIARWKQHRQELQTQYEQGGSAEIKSRNLVFAGDEHKVYIALVDTRILTLDCLKRETMDRQTASFDTAAGGARPVVQEASLVEGQELSVDVAPMCQKGVPGFMLTNLGERWPRIAEVSIYRTDTNAKIAHRRVRMINSQQLMFKVPEDMADGVGEAAIFIEPSWYERRFVYDAKMRC